MLKSYKLRFGKTHPLTLAALLRFKHVKDNLAHAQAHAAPGDQALRNQALGNHAQPHAALGAVSMATKVPGGGSGTAAPTASKPASLICCTLT